MRLLFVLVACTQPDYVSGHLHCATSGRACPDDFYCGAGSLCWKNGSGPEMGSSLPDLSVRPLPDLTAAVEDLAGADLAGADLKPLPDLSVSFDLTTNDMARNPSLCPGSFKICDGFEDATINALWSQDTSGGTFTLDNTFSYRGNQSLHLHDNGAAAAGADPFTNLVTHMAFPLSGVAYARVFFYFPPSFPGNFTQVINFSNTGGSGVAFGTKNNHPVLNDYASPADYAESTATIMTGQWVCLSLSVTQTASTGTVKVFVHDAEATDVTTTTSGTPTMDHVYIGLDWNNNPANQPPTDVWIDEVVINDSPVSCTM